MRKEGKAAVAFDSDDALLSSPSNELVNSGLFGGTKKTKIVLTNSDVGSPMTVDGETYGSYREITTPLPESRRGSSNEVGHLHDTHHMTMYGNNHGSGSSPGTTSGLKHHNSSSYSEASSGLFGSRASRGSFMNNNAIIDVEDEEDEDVYEVDASLEQEMEREKEELVLSTHPHPLLTTHC